MDCFVPSLVVIGPVVLKNYIFKFRVCIFVISKLWPFIWTHLNLLCPSGSGEEDLLYLLIYFRYFVIISPWKREETWIPFIKECFVPNLVEIGIVFLEKMKLRQLRRRRQHWRRRTTDKFWSEKLSWAFGWDDL